MLLCTVIVYDLTVPRCRLSTYAVRLLGVPLCRPDSGTLCLINSEIRTVSIVLNGSWKQFSLAATSVTGAWDVFFLTRCAYNLHFTYLLIEF